MAISILEQAAELREKARVLKDLLSDMRQDGGSEWTHLAIAADEAEEIARTGLRQSWSMLDRIYSIAKSQPKRAEPPTTEGGHG